MKHLDNTYDPTQPDAKERTYCTTTDKTPEEAWQHYQEWLEGKIIGEPKATDTYTVEELKAMNIVGVYKP